jgi:DNA-binding transcriptional LysR family regulator
MLDPRRLRLLRDLAQHGTIAAVAAAHTYTPSAVSQQLATLEREAGVSLLERSGRRVALTPAGRTLVQHAEEVLAALDVALVHDYDLVPIEPDPALRTVALLDETIFVAAGAARTLPECRDEPWILASPGTLCHTMTVRACEAAGFSPRVRHHADDFVTVLTFVAAGQGVALIPELAAAEVPGGVVLTPLDTRRRTRLAFRAGAAQHPAVAAFAESLGTRTEQ